MSAETEADYLRRIGQRSGSEHADAVVKRLSDHRDWGARDNGGRADVLDVLEAAAKLGALRTTRGTVGMQTQTQTDALDEAALLALPVSAAVITGSGTVWVKYEPDVWGRCQRVEAMFRPSEWLAKTSPRLAFDPSRAALSGGAAVEVGPFTVQRMTDERLTELTEELANAPAGPWWVDDGMGVEFFGTQLEAVIHAAGCAALDARRALYAETSAAPVVIADAATLVQRGMVAAALRAAARALAVEDDSDAREDGGGIAASHGHTVRARRALITALERGARS